MLPEIRYTTFADVLGSLGVPAERVRFDLKPGRATIRDLKRAEREGHCELVDGFVVHKGCGRWKGYLGLQVGFHIGKYLQEQDIGYLLGGGGTFRLRSGLVRAPDLSFVSWSKCPDRVVADEYAPAMAPDLAVEVMGATNTRKEMARKVREYFSAGTRLTWIIDGWKRTAKVYTSPAEFTTLTAADSLDGGDVLPGFMLPLAKLFAKLGPARKGRKKGK